MNWLLGIALIVAIACVGCGILRAAILARALTKLFFERARASDIDRFRLKSVFYDGDNIYFPTFFRTDFAKACDVDAELSALRRKVIRAYLLVPFVVSLTFLLLLFLVAILSMIGGHPWHRV